MSHDAESELDQKLLTADFFSGILLINNISVTINNTRVEKYFFRTYIIRTINWDITLTAVSGFNFRYYNA